jgi:hypothetical protein
LLAAGAAAGAAEVLGALLLGALLLGVLPLGAGALVLGVAGAVLLPGGAALASEPPPSFLVEL